MERQPDATPGLTVAEQRLLGGWRDVRDDIRRLATAFERVPDECACGDGSAHLEATCPCCGSDRTAAATCESCTAIMRSLAERFERLADDRLRFVPAVDDQLQVVSPGEGPARLARVSRTIAAVTHAFYRLQSATDEFRSGCSTTHLRAMRPLTVELTAAAAELERIL